MVSRDGDPERESDGQSASNDGDGLSAAVDHHALYRARHDGRMRRLEAVALIRVRLAERRTHCSGRVDRRPARADRRRFAWTGSLASAFSSTARTRRGRTEASAVLKHGREGDVALGHGPPKRHEVPDVFRDRLSETHSDHRPHGRGRLEKDHETFPRERKHRGEAGLSRQPVAESIGRRAAGDAQGAKR